MYNLLESIKVLSVKDSVVAGTTLITSAASDMAGYDGIMYIAKLGTVTDASVLQLTPFSIATSTTTGGTAISNATTTAATAATSSNMLIISDVIKQTSRYSYATLSRTAQNAELHSMTAILYRTRGLPVTQATTAGVGVLASAVGGAI